MTIPSTFQSYRIHSGPDGTNGRVESIGLDQLNAGDIVVKTAYSSVNYKDALAGSGQGKILRQYPLVGGIDVAGHVVQSTDPRFKEGDAVLVTGCGLSETRDGGYGDYARLESKWALPVPTGLSLAEAMILGTAGFTAALSLWRMEANGQTPEMGPIVVTGATGGVGMLAIDLLAKAGYEVHAISGKPEQFDALIALGARQCIARQQLDLGSRPLETAIWAGAIDNVGGDTLAALSRVIRPYGNIASCGLAASAELHASVMPFIIRGVSILGIASAGTAYHIRRTLWERLATIWKPQHLDKIHTRTVALDELDGIFATMLAGGSFGRTLVRF